MDSRNEKIAFSGNIPMSPKAAPLENRKRVLLLAFTCSPYHGSESGTGWWRALETAKYFETWVISSQGEEFVKKWFSENREIPNLHFWFLPLTNFEIYLGKSFMSKYIAYNLWQRRAYSLAVKLNEEAHFDLVHQVNLSTFREPGYLFKMKVPFIWGPVGGTENYPWKFLTKAGIIGALYEGTRNIANFLQFRFNRRVRKAARVAKVVLTVHSKGKEWFEQIQKIKPFPMLDLGTTSVRKKIMVRGKRQGPFRILWVGSFLHGKALHLLIEALSDICESYPYELRILGRGSLEKRWRRLISKKGIEAKCKWMGWVTREEVFSQYEWADILAFTSLREACGSVIIEALSQGLPIICFDHHGAGDVINDMCGVKIPVSQPRETILKLRTAIIDLAQNRERLDVLAHGALMRAQDFVWSRKGEVSAEIYYKEFKKVS